MIQEEQKITRFLKTLPIAKEEIGRLTNWGHDIKLWEGEWWHDALATHELKVTCLNYRCMGCLGGVLGSTLWPFRGDAVNSLSTNALWWRIMCRFNVLGMGVTNSTSFSKRGSPSAGYFKFLSPSKSASVSSSLRSHSHFRIFNTIFLNRLHKSLLFETNSPKLISPSRSFVNILLQRCMNS